jgi:GT2 family glycosyltransferase
MVIDNGFSDVNSKRINQLNDNRLFHHSVGYNSGPAGGAYWGMKLLFERGYDWVIWVDDDDPPKFDDLFENLFKIISDNDCQSLGMVGAVGERFDNRNAKIVRLKDDQLKGYLNMDTISGGMFPVVSKRIYQHGILPSMKFFFGFEELNFCLLIKQSGFRIITSGELHFKHRELMGRLNLNKNNFIKRSENLLWREYYSVRNLLYILIYQQFSFLGIFHFVLRNISKSLFVFKYGFSYGKKANYMILKGLFDGILGRMGNRILPSTKQLTTN